MGMDCGFRWTSTNDIPWPTKQHADVIRAEKINRDDVIEILSIAKKIRDDANDMKAYIRTLEQANALLEQENKFLLKIVNQESQI